MVVGGRCAEEQLKGSRGAASPAWPSIQQVCGGGQGLDPERLGHACMKEGAHTIVERPNDALGLPVLGRSVWAGKPERDAMI